MIRKIMTRRRFACHLRMGSIAAAGPVHIREAKIGIIYGLKPRKHVVITVSPHAKFSLKKSVVFASFSTVGANFSRPGKTEVRFNV